MLKRAVIVAGTAVLVGLLLVLVAWRLWSGPGPRPRGEGTSTQVHILAGTTLSAAADSLVAHGLLRDRRVLLIGARLTGKERALKAGLYDLPFGASPRELLQAVTSGAAVQVKVTIPEGLDAVTIAALVADSLSCDAEEFLAVADSLVRSRAERGDLLGGVSAATHDSLLAVESARHPRRFHWCEGHLAADTFLFAAGTSAATAATFLVTTQWARLDSVLSGPGGFSQPHLSPQDFLTLASIVEAEARQADERTRVAAVYLNRLRQGWRLEADPTVAYILLKKGKRLYYRNLEVASTFNTYRNKGLPPGPIGSPGFAALQAAARPDTTCQAMYFVSDGRGGHVFSRTLQEHEAAVREFRRRRAAAGRSQD